MRDEVWIRNALAGGESLPVIKKIFIIFKLMKNKYEVWL
jgi:hypothetical protein